MKTVLTGITRNYSNEDGELEAMENLRHDGASLRPIGDVEKIEMYENYGTEYQREFQMPDYEKIVFVHQFRGREFVISYRETEADSNLYLLGELIGNVVAVNKDNNGYVNILSCPGLIKIVQLGIYLYVHTQDKDYTLRMEYNEKLEEIAYTNLDVSLLNLQLYADEINNPTTREYYHNTNPADKNDLKNRIESVRYISSNVGTINNILSSVKSEGLLYDACMVRAAIRLKSGDYICHTAPILLHPIGGNAVKLTDTVYDGTGYIKDENDSNLTYYRYFRGDLEIDAYELKIQIPPLSEINTFKDEIDSIDLFIATIPNILTDSTLPEVNQSYVDGIYIEKDGYNLAYLMVYKSRIFESGNLSERIKGVSIEDFKYVKSYSLSQIKVGVEETINLKEFNSGSVELRSLNGDGNRNDKCGNPFVYNNELHLFNIAEVLFRGYTPISFLLDGKDDSSVTGIGVGFSGANSIASVSDRIEGSKGLGYMISYPDREMNKAEVRVLAKKGDNYFYGNKFFTLDKFLFIPATFVLGESKKELYIRQTQDGTVRKTGVHEQINKIDVPLSEIEEINPGLFNFPIDDKNKRENILKVSDVLNPLVFPVSQTYQVGQGEIKDLAVASTALSQGQFGQFPLYVFCSDGIYAMNVGTGNVVYTNSTPVSRDVITGDLISIDKAVAFISDRGLKILQGDSAVDVSLQMQSNAYEQLQGEKFEDFIKDAKLAYNYFFGEIYLLRDDKDFAFVYELKNQTWATRKINFKGKLEVYPDLYIQTKEGEVVRLSRELAPDGRVHEFTLKTRPMNWGDGFKKVARMIIRGLVMGNWEIRILASNDGVNFNEVRRASITTDTPKRDIPFGRISGSFKSYILEIKGTMDERAYIEYVETELQDSIFNKKIR